MADTIVRRARGVFAGKVGSTATVAGDGVYFDGTDWELADADDNTKFAEAFSTASFASGVQGTFCTECIIEDTDAPYTQGSTFYLSATAGDITSARPTGANNLMQVLGFALSTSEVHARVKIPEEVVFTVNFHSNTDEAGYIGIASNDFGGPTVIDNSGVAYGSYMVPQNVVGNVIQYLAWIAGGTALDSSDTYTIDVAAGVDDEVTTTHADGIGALALTVAANDINTVDVSAAFDGSGQQEPGNWVGIAVAKAAEGSGGDDPGILGVHVVLLGV
jgi:hypothetical protein